MSPLLTNRNHTHSIQQSTIIIYGRSLNERTVGGGCRLGGDEGQNDAYECPAG